MLTEGVCSVGMRKLHAAFKASVLEAKVVVCSEQFSASSRRMSSMEATPMIRLGSITRSRPHESGSQQDKAWWKHQEEG